MLSVPGWMMMQGFGSWVTGFVRSFWSGILGLQGFCKRLRSRSMRFGHLRGLASGWPCWVASRVARPASRAFRLPCKFSGGGQSFRLACQHSSNWVRPTPCPQVGAAFAFGGFFPRKRSFLNATLKVRWLTVDKQPASQAL